MTSRKVRYAIIGFGAISQSRIAPEGFALDSARFPAHETAVLVGATSHSPSRQSEVERLGLAWYPTEAAVLSDPGVDAVFIATTNATHVPIALAALAAGKHVICEKPMSTNVADAERVAALAAERNLSVAINHMMQFNAYNVAARDLVRSGAAGRVNDAVFHMEFGLAIDAAASRAWRCAAPEERGGPIGDVASHCFYSLEFVLGSPIRSLAAVYFPKITQTAVEDGAIIRVTLASGVNASVRVSFCDARGCERGTVANMGYEIYGDAGVIRSYGTLFQASGHNGEAVKLRLELDDFESVRTIPPGRITNIYAAVVLKHAESVLRGPRQDGQDAVHNLRLCAAAHESAQNGGKIIAIA
jgi:1,5-anhydro-D-fructose reductase (1,5-anhydro-D-mannitol-forming)